VFCKWKVTGLDFRQVPDYMGWVRKLCTLTRSVGMRIECCAVCDFIPEGLAAQQQFINNLAAVLADFDHAILTFGNEPYHYQPGRRSNRPEEFFMAGVAAAMFTGGATAHGDSLTMQRCVVPGPIEAQCASELFRGIDTVPIDAPTWMYCRYGLKRAGGARRERYARRCAGPRHPDSLDGGAGASRVDQLPLSRRGPQRVETQRHQRVAHDAAGWPVRAQRARVTHVWWCERACSHHDTPRRLKIHQIRRMAAKSVTS
jgi:hypothetical protein